MIVLRHRTTGEAQSVPSMEAIDTDVWEVLTGVAPPPDSTAQAYELVGTAWTPVAPVVTLFEYLQLWTAGEQAAAFTSADPEMVVARTLAMASPTIDLGNEQVIAGIALAVSLGIVTEARAERIRAGLPPEAGS